MASEIWTHADAIDYLRDALMLQSQSDLVLRMARAAVRTVYRDLPSVHDWNYLKRRGQVIVTAPYATGTIAYDHTGGSSERLITLSGGTFPSWARYGTLLINNVSYKVSSNPSSTTLTLDEYLNPGSDVASGTTYSLVRTQYPLPTGFKTVESLFDTSSQVAMEYVDPATLHHLAMTQKAAGAPRWWTIRGVATDYPGQVVLEVHPPPSSARTIEFQMENACRDLLLAPEHDVGTVSVSGTAVTGTSTSFPADCVGAVIRFGHSDAKPTALWGDNPYKHQSIITARGSSTTVTLLDAPSESLTDVGYTISDPLDLNPGPMTTYFLKACEFEAASLIIQDQRIMAAKLMARDAALKLAMAADFPRSVIPMWGDGVAEGWLLRDWRVDP